MTLKRHKYRVIPPAYCKKEALIFKTLYFMKMRRFFTRMTIAATLTLIVVEKSHARLFGSSYQYLGTQAAHSGLCQEFGMKKTYFFGILVSEEMVFTVVSCN